MMIMKTIIDKEDIRKNLAKEAEEVAQDTVEEDIMTMMKIIKDKDKDNNVLHMKMIIK